MTNFLRLGFGFAAIGAGAIVFLFGQEFFQFATPGCCEADDQVTVAALAFLFLVFALVCLSLSLRIDSAKDYSFFDRLLFIVVSLMACFILGLVALAGLVASLAGPSVVVIVCLAAQYARHRNRKTSSAPTP